MRRTPVLAAILLAAAFQTAAMIVPASAETVMVAPGNRNVEQPAVPGGSARRTRQLGTTYEAKYRKIYALLKNDARLRDKIRETAAAYGIDPMHMVGAIVGEHTYNVDAYDRLQTYYVKAASYLSGSFAFRHDGENVGDFVRRPQFSACAGSADSYALWTCRSDVWERDFRGKTVEGRRFPDNRFGAVFFQPLFAGQTFGLGQLNPLTALMMTDMVHKVSGLPLLNAANPQRVYETIMDPDLTLPYVAATLRKAIDAYRRIAGFDISGNPGLTATLYNVGDPEARARALAAENAARGEAGEAPRLPQENYYGWLVNEKLPELRALF